MMISQNPEVEGLEFKWRGVGCLNPILRKNRALTYRGRPGLIKLRAKFRQEKA